MITLTSLADARVLVIGNDDLTATVIRNLNSNGVQDITLMNKEGSNLTDAKNYVQKDALEHISVDVDYYKSFSLVLALNQPRELELALSDARWPKDGQDGDPDLPMMVSRSDENRCKMRCQYRELPYAKKQEIAAVIRHEFPGSQDESSRFRQFLVAGRVIADFQKVKGAWPSESDTPGVLELLADDVNSSDIVKTFVDQL
ncbi:hypothetical protein SBRCBS47491_006923 [Sporothrix bragantina]|uniref:Uncharacterized protein n=1 Tax=Sporothrix bragantina TaxID=671064 RepID=A0ABP0C9K8_9PEZI